MCSLGSRDYVLYRLYFLRSGCCAASFCSLLLLLDIHLPFYNHLSLNPSDFIPPSSTNTVSKGKTGNDPLHRPLAP